MPVKIDLTGVNFHLNDPHHQAGDLMQSKCIDLT